MHLLEGLIKQYWPHLTGGTLTVCAIIFKDTLNDIWIGFKQYVGAKWAERFSENRRKRSRRTADVQIGALTQQVKDLKSQFTGFKRETQKILAKTQSRLELCQAERTECKSDLANLLVRVNALERK